MTDMHQDYELVGSQPSYYSAKVRACLQYKRLPYREIGSNTEVLGKRVIPATGDHTFPVVFCPDGTVLKDGCDIVDALESRHPERSILPEDPVLALVAQMVELMADEFFVVAAVYYRWLPKDTRAWAVEMFSELATKGINDPNTLQAAKVMSSGMAQTIEGRVLKAGLGQDEMQRECVRLTERLCVLLDQHFADTGFAMGDRPTLADLGLMNAMWGHLFLDPCDASMHIRRNCLHLSQWIGQMHCAAGIAHEGRLRLTESFQQVLEFFGEAFGQLSRDMIEAADRAIPEMEVAAKVRPGMGRIESQFGEVSVSRPTSTYTAWRMQRIGDHYAALSSEDKSRAKAIFEPAGLLHICLHRANWRLEKRNFKLVRAA